QHGLAIKRAGLRSRETLGENVDGVVVGVRPHTILWIIWKIRAKIEFIAVVRARGVRRGGNGHTLFVLREVAVVLQLAHQPAPGKMVIQHHRVATIQLEFAGTAETAPNGVDGRRAEYRST